MAIEEIIAYRDRNSCIHTSKLKAEQAEAWLDLLDAFDGDDEICNRLFIHKNVIRAYLDATEAMYKETRG